VTEHDIPSRRPSVARGIVALVFAVLAVAFAVLSFYGVWNPRHYVTLLMYFNNPVGDGTVLLILLLVAYWCALPIRNSAIDRRRSIVRSTAIIVIIISIFVLTFTYAIGIWRYRPSILGTPRDGRSLAVVSVFRGTEIHVLIGTGLARRDVGNLGSACGLPSDMDAEWINANEVKITTAYNTYDVLLNPKTGVPLQHFGATCLSQLVG
jgi:succinate dehydrogenase hydrophobic anchor subunit